MTKTTRRLFVALSAIGFAAAVSAHDWSVNYSGAERIKGSGDIATEARDVGGFDGISMSGGFKVLVRQGSAAKVELKADRNILQYIETKVVDGRKGRVLEISTRKGVSLTTDKTPSLVLEMPSLRSIAIAGSGDVKVEAMKTAEVTTNIAGSGNVVFDKLDSESLGVKVAGSGDVVAAGRTGKLDVTIAGSGDVRTDQLVAEEAKVSIAGSGDAKVNAQKKLHVSIAGSGDVSYAGSPELSMSIMGGGKVKKIN